MRPLLRDEGSKDMSFPAEYMFKDHPEWDIESENFDPVAFVVDAMDRNGVAQAVLLTAPDGTDYDEYSGRALREHPDRFFLGSASFDPNDVMGTIRGIERHVKEHDAKLIQFFPAGTSPTGGGRASPPRSPRPPTPTTCPRAARRARS